MNVTDQSILLQSGASIADQDHVAAPMAIAQPQSLLSAIIGLAKDPAVDVTKLQALLTMQERMEVRQAEAAFNAAFVAMQSRLPRITKDGTLKYPVNKNDPEGKQRIISRYATWDAIDAAIRPILTDHGFALSFTTAQGTNGVLSVSAILRHQDGHATETPGPPLPCDSSGGKNNIQGWGSALSYGKRYAATAALNIVTEGEDDDAKLAGMAFLKNEQVDELRALIEETGTDEQRFVGLFGVQHLGEIQQGAFVAAKNMLLLKAKKPE